MSESWLLWTIEHYYGWDSFFSQKYLLHLPAVYGIKCIGENCKKRCRLKAFCTNSFNDSTDSQIMWSCRSLSSKIVFIFTKNFLNFWSAAIEKHTIIYLSRYESKSLALLYLIDSEVTFLKEGVDAAFVHLSIVLFTVLRNRGCILSNFLVFHASWYISTRSTVFLF